MTQKDWARLALFLAFGFVGGLAATHGAVWILAIVALVTIFAAPSFVRYNGAFVASLGFFIGFLVKGFMFGTSSEGAFWGSLIAGVVAWLASSAILAFSFSLRKKKPA